MTRPLEGKLGIVTGASRGIGAAIAENLASKGCNLVLNYTSASSTEPAAAFAAELSSEHNIQAVSIQADVGTPSGAAQLIAKAQASFTTSRFQIDIIINNAGIARNALIPHVTVPDFEETYRVNAAVEAMTRTWARELAENATVNAVNPGPVEGPMYAANSPEFLAGIKGWVMHTPLMKAREGVDSEEEVRDAVESGEAGQDEGDPFDTLLTLEDQFYTEGYNEGFADGEVAGRSEGRQLGLERASVTAGPVGGGGGEEDRSEEDVKRELPPLLQRKDGGRLEKHVRTLYALAETESLSTENTDEAVDDFDDRLRRAQGRAKIIGRTVGRRSWRGKQYGRGQWA
ncbi:hypothetical protein N0V88_002539 [Collariella sp. IMI 366227]|nr:hypothetical protein N0V88_002539 [Collariella sp. IMI 366227]